MNMGAWATGYVRWPEMPGKYDEFWDEWQSEKDEEVV